MQNQRDPFNEIYDSDGNIRSHYQATYLKWKSLSASRRRKLHRHSKKLFAGDYHLDPLPRIITNSELTILQNGVKQRADAIRRFLVDYYGGEKRWTKIIPPVTMKAIMDRNHSKSMLGKLHPKAIAFPFGPDIMRDRYGQWRVIEDSAGCLGGFGDLVESRKIMFRLIPGYQRIFKESNRPIDFYERLASRFCEKAKQKGGVPLLFLSSFSDQEDNETRRLANIFESLGIDVATPECRDKQILIENNGIFLQTLKRKKRVGYLALRSCPEYMDSHCFSIGLKSLLGTKTQVIPFPEICKIRRVVQNVRDITIQSCLLKNKVWTNFSPGVQFVNDKVFGLFVDPLIRFYLKEDPIIKSIPAHSFAYRSQSGHWRINKWACKNVLRNKDRFVVKCADEDGGSGVWIGDKLKRKDFIKVMRAVYLEPEKYIFQEFEHLSVLENRIVDLRIHAHVDRDEIIISNNPWGRANWTNGNGKVNLCGSGFTSPVVVAG